MPLWVDEWGGESSFRKVKSCSQDNVAVRGRAAFNSKVTPALISVGVGVGPGGKKRRVTARGTLKTWPLAWNPASRHFPGLSPAGCPPAL